MVVDQLENDLCLRYTEMYLVATMCLSLGRVTSSLVSLYVFATLNATCPQSKHSYVVLCFALL